RFSLPVAVGARASLSPDHTTIVTTDGEGLALWRSTDGSLIRSRPLVSVKPFALDVSNDRYVTRTSAGIVVGGFDLADPTILVSPPPIRLAIDPGGHRIAAVFQNRYELMLWDMSRPN